MKVSSPHYLLFPNLGGEARAGRWRFVLRSLDGSFCLEAEDEEPDTGGERLELLAVVRGLEAIDRPSRVTLLTASSYVREGIRHGVMDWRRRGWRWERFGQMVPIKNLDLWQRVDRAMRFHQIDCRPLWVDSPEPVAAARELRADAESSPSSCAARRSLQYRCQRLSSRLAHGIAAGLRAIGWMAQGAPRANHRGVG